MGDPDSPMQASLGSFLRQLRCASHLSQVRVAQLASISHTTLSRWESGTRIPHKSDLGVLLRVLSATVQQHQHALSLLESQHQRQEARHTYHLTELEKVHVGIGPKPHPGSLLWAMRMRRRLSQEDVARRIGVTERTLRRWEKSEVVPSPTQIHTLCYVLEAHTEEMMALTLGHFPSQRQLEVSHTLSLEELLNQARTLYFNLEGCYDDLKDLCFFQLEAQAWPLALRSSAGLEALSQIYSYHANSLSSHERWVESSVYANRVLDLLPNTASPQSFHVMAALASARVLVYRDTHTQPEKGIELLRHWQDVTHWPEHKAWLLSDIAKYMALAGDPQGGLTLTRQACEIAKQCENPAELAYRELDEAQILIQVGQPAQALFLTQRHLERILGLAHLIEGEALLSLSAPIKAQERLQGAWQIIREQKLEILRHRARQLERRLLIFS